MQLPRRQVLRLVAGAVALPAAAAIAETYPDRPVHLVVGFAPGGAVDIVARLMGQWLSQRLGQPVIVDNKTGGGSNIATQAVVTAPPDGYTLLTTSGSNAVNATFYAALPFDFVRDIAPVAGLISYPLVMIVNPAVPARNVAEFIAYAKSGAGQLTMASYGTGTTGHLTGELFKTMAGINLIHVPYRGEALALTDMMSGQVQMMFATAPGSIQHIRAGRVRALAVSTAKRWDQLPDVPSVGETVAGFDASSWTALGAPRSTPTGIIEQLAREVNAGLSDPGLRARFSELALTPMPMTPAELGAFTVAETEKWGKVVRAANIKPE